MMNQFRTLFYISYIALIKGFLLLNFLYNYFSNIFKLLRVPWLLQVFIRHNSNIASSIQPVNQPNCLSNYFRVLCSFSFCLACFLFVDLNCCYCFTEILNNLSQSALMANHSLNKLTALHISNCNQSNTVLDEKTVFTIEYRENKGLII